ncbi:MAG: SPFH domain-containing protein [Lachnospiraceae bacterium]|nr:SPFH domain-containing protein [Lachnospiraceae bacterium]
MGLIKAAMGAIGGTLADQWKEYFYCPAIDSQYLMVEGQKKVNGRSSNTKGEENVITNGSIIAVADGQCMVIVDQGKIVEVSAEPGAFQYDNSSSPSVFAGGLGAGFVASCKDAWERLSFGGIAARTQKVYFFNMLEILDNKFGTAQPIEFRIVDSKVNLDMDTSLRIHGTYSYKITDPLLFYTNVCGNAEGAYPRSKLDSTLKAEFSAALMTVVPTLSDLELRPNQIPSHTEELTERMNAKLTEKWSKGRGISIASLAIESATIPEEDKKALQDFQKMAVNKDPGMLNAASAAAYNQALVAAANNQGGAMMGFMGMNMMQQAAGGMNPAGFVQNAQAMQQQQQQAAPQQAAAPAAAPAAAGWTCECGHSGNTGKFCAECGKPQPAQEAGWTCSCGAVNKGKFCAECGKPKPAGAPLYKCDKCGWEPEDPHNPPKFCPQCGDPFDDSDKV